MFMYGDLQVWVTRSQGSVCVWCWSLHGIWVHFCKSVLSQFVSEHNFPVLSQDGIAAGRKKEGFKFYKHTHTRCRCLRTLNCALFIFISSEKQNSACRSVPLSFSHTCTSFQKFYAIYAKFSFDWRRTESFICFIWCAVETETVQLEKNYLTA